MAAPFHPQRYGESAHYVYGAMEARLGAPSAEHGGDPPAVDPAAAPVELEAVHHSLDERGGSAEVYRGG